MLIDSHCHLDRLDLTPYDGNLDALLRAARDRGVSRMLCVSIDLPQFEQMYEAVSGYADVDLSVGVHPLHVEESPVTAEQLVELSKRQGIVALGETGLDYYYQTDSKAAQQQCFVEHLKASRSTGLPLIVHTRDARDDTIALIREHGDPQVAGVLHCFTESWQMAEQALELGYYVSFSGIITFRNAEALREVVRQMPMERLLIETDAPYLAPVPHRGKKNEPQYVYEVAQLVAELKGLTLQQVADQTADNYRTLFHRR
ncbi:TatD family hydrolase [Marinobacterium arenosum]|uniref:TatD family hydrolase n=1 Tax=Marinobacterium arenosum TaxID=2862496 RepID=UPI001C947840|nr:TatD family hydrolase [Marinobacterium arenosum]MBY4677185.1 TatD family hydrolase [Marinobacterium arenosum]